MESLFYYEGNLHKGVLVFKAISDEETLGCVLKMLRHNIKTAEPEYSDIRSARTVDAAFQLLGFNVQVDNNVLTLTQKHKNLLHQGIWYMGAGEVLSMLKEHIMDGSIIETDNGFDQLYTFSVVNGNIVEEWHSIHLNNDGTYKKYEFENTQAD